MAQRSKKTLTGGQREWSRWRTGLAAAAVAVLVAACGGSDPYEPGTGSPSGGPTAPPSGGFTSLVSFGDSLSDVGAYTPATVIPGTNPPVYIGGKFTTNGPGGTVWVENLAASLGLIITPAEVGFAGQSIACPAAAQGLGTTCTGYGQGGSRVTDPNGIGKAGGALTVPVKTQIANHLARFGSFTANDLVVVFGGNNDAFTQFGIFAAKAAQIQADAQAGRITPEQAQQLLLDAQLAGFEEMKKAGLELAGYVKSDILAKGGKYVAVWNLPDSVMTPFGQSLPAQVRPVLTGMIDIFNLWLREGLTDQPVRLVDANASFRDAYMNPAKYGFTNNTVPACDAAKIAVITGGQITDGSSLFCNATPGVPFNGLRDGADVNTWQFADGVHPTTGAQKVISDTALQQLKSFGWVN
jgi:phospholipase/lecithinase/hemolysin